MTDIEADLMIANAEIKQLQAQLEATISGKEMLQKALAASQRRAQTARNELCLKCGRYHEAHNGACNGCRWKENEHDNTQAEA